MESNRKDLERPISDTPQLLEEHKYREMVEKANDGFAVSQDGVVYFVNQYLVDLFGYTEEEMLGSSFMKFVAPEERQRLADIYARRMGGGEAPPRYEMLGLKKDGTTIWIENNSSVTTFNGRPALINILRDISARKSLEAERAALEDQLRQSEKLQAIGQLAGGVAHDFNNQLMGIVGFAHLLKLELQGQPELECNVDGILTAAHQAADLTRQLLAFARKGKYVNKPVDLHRVITEVIGLLTRSIDKRVRIEKQLGAVPSTVLGDPTQLQNAVLNLAINARDSMPGGGELRFTTEAVELDEEFCQRHNDEIVAGRYLKLSVGDTGVGMDEETQQHIFEPFFTTKEQGAGTGIGLASVYGTVANHRGTVQVDSAVGRGTTISLCLPLLEGENEEETEKASPAEKGKAQRHGHIFLIDDEPLLCDVTGRMLKSLGYQVTTCEDAHRAIEIYRSSHRSIDLVIVDMMMPRMDGGELFRALKEINPDILALLASGYSLNEAAQKTLDEGMKGFIQKPFSIERLASVLDDLLAAEKFAENA